MGPEWHYRVHKSLPLVPILSQIYLVNTFSPYSQTIHSKLNLRKRYNSTICNSNILVVFSFGISYNIENELFLRRAQAAGGSSTTFIHKT